MKRDGCLLFGPFGIGLRTVHYRPAVFVIINGTNFKLRIIAVFLS